MVATILMAGLLMAQSVPPDSRYLIVGTQKIATMEKELSEAALKGYRILWGSNTGGTEKVLLLEKADNPEPVEYLLLSAQRSDQLEEELNSAALRGFRLLPRTVMRELSKDPEHVLLILEKQPEMPSHIRQYLAVSFQTEYTVSFPADRRRLSLDRLSNVFTLPLLKTRVTGRLDTEAVDRKLAEIAAQGYQPVSLLTRNILERSLDKDGQRKRLRTELIVLFEKPRQAAVPASAEALMEAAQLYHVMTGVGPEIAFSKGEREMAEEEFEEMLNTAAMLGYRLLAAAPVGFPEMIALMQRNPVGVPLKSYRVLMAKRTSTLRNELLQMAQGGWVPHPHGLLDTGSTATGGPGEIVMVTERVVGSTSAPLEQMLLATTRTSTLSKELSQAEGQGYEVLTAGAGRGEVVVILRRRN